MPQHMTVRDVDRLAAAGDARLVQALRFGRHREVVMAAHYSLFARGGRAVAPLVAFVNDDFSPRGQRASWTLNRTSAPAAGLLVRQMRGSPIPRQRADAAWVLAHVPGPPAGRALIALLDDPSDEVKLAATQTLCWRGCSDAGASPLRLLTRFQARTDTDGLPYTAQVTYHPTEVGSRAGTWSGRGRSAETRALP